MAVSHGEMPFLDHLEELRSRILKGLAAVIVGFAVGFWVVQQFEFVTLLKAPIAPYLPDGRLTYLSPTEPVMIVLKLSLLIGLVLASPVLLYQIWGFLSPALYEKERRAFVPALLVGTLLFIVGAAIGYVFVVPQALRVLFSFQSEALQPMITYDAYFGFVVQIVIGLGLSFEIPLVITILAGFGLVTPAALNRFRRFEVVLAFVAGALLCPGADVLSMFMMTVPILLLYEVGVRRGGPDASPPAPPGGRGPGHRPGRLGRAGRGAGADPAHEAAEGRPGLDRTRGRAHRFGGPRQDRERPGSGHRRGPPPRPPDRARVFPFRGRTRRCSSCWSGPGSS